MANSTVLALQLFGLLGGFMGLMTLIEWWVKR